MILHTIIDACTEHSNKLRVSIMRIFVCFVLRVSIDDISVQNSKVDDRCVGLIEFCLKVFAAAALCPHANTLRKHDFLLCLPILFGLLSTFQLG